MKASEIIARYEAYCPRELSMEGDISGLQIGTLDKDVKRVMIALDVRETTVAEVIEKGVDLIIVKHAPIFKPLKDLVATAQNQIYIDLVRHDIAVYVSHTNIDIVPDGLNDWFCELLEIKDTDILTPTADGYGIGRIGKIEEQTFSDFALKVKEKIKDAVLMFVTAPDAGTLRDRLVGRGTETPEVIAARLARACEESEGIENYDYLVVNDTVDHASALIDQLICDEQSQNTGRDQAYRVSANIDFINQMRENLKSFSKGE